MVRIISKEFDSSLVENVYINKNIVESQIRNLTANNCIQDKRNMKAWLLKVIIVIDLTTLSGDDTASNVKRLCIKAASPLSPATIKKLAIHNNERVKTAAVCVYPSRVKDAYDCIKLMELTNEIQIASVATGFPSGLYPLQTRLQEIKFAVSSGATEIDVVLDRSLVLMGKWDCLYNEVQQMRNACSDIHLKVILGVGELGSYENVYKASMVSMMAGADFIKTSTGKEAVNATLPVGLVMCRAIRNFYLKTGFKVGLKPAGGIKTSQDAINWLILVLTELGPEWLSPKLFRIGASSLLDVIENDLRNIV